MSQPGRTQGFRRVRFFYFLEKGNKRSEFDKHSSSCSPVQSKSFPTIYNSLFLIVLEKSPFLSEVPKIVKYIQHK